jgi:hypothetical protein
MHSQGPHPREVSIFG